MRRSFTLLIIVALIISAIVWKSSSTSTEYKKLLIGEKTIILEIADSDSERSQGLSGRQSLKKDQGLLFVFPTPGTYTFWMKEMKFPLDFLWMRDKVVVDLTQNVPAPLDNDETKLQFYQPKEPVNEVIEFNSGLINELDIKIGDKLNY